MFPTWYVVRRYYNRKDNAEEILAPPWGRKIKPGEKK